MTERNQGNLTRRELAQAVSAGAGLSLRGSSDIVDAVFLVLKEAMIAGEPIKLARFGSFLVRDKAPRRGRNPRTGEDITIRERRRITFRPSRGETLNPPWISMPLALTEITGICS